MGKVLSPPLPWKGGKARVAARVWELLGNVDHYVELFAGMASVLLARPPAHDQCGRHRFETINDINVFVVNFWRSLRYKPAELAAFGDWPVSEIDNRARLKVLDKWSGDRLAEDPCYCDPEVAAWWALAVSQAVASRVGPGLPELAHAGRGWQGIRLRNRAGSGETGTHHGTYLKDLEQRLKYVRLAHGDYRRLLTPAVLLPSAAHRPIAGLYADPPYGVDRYAEEVGGSAFDPTSYVESLEAVVDTLGDRVRIVASGFADSFAFSDRWSCEPWVGSVGHYKGTRPQEVLWTWNAADARQPSLFGGLCG